jgi:Zn finger protein HypA/HybF involved in hydrogenase expression
MPVFLVCRQCDHQFSLTKREVIESEQTRCPACHSEAVRQTFSSYLHNGSLSTLGAHSWYTFGCGGPPLS